jgi:hypothetical protein
MESASNTLPLGVEISIENNNSIFSVARSAGRPSQHLARAFARIDVFSLN